MIDDAWKQGFAACLNELLQALREVNGPHDEEHLVEKTDLCSRMGIDLDELDEW